MAMVQVMFRPMETPPELPKPPRPLGIAFISILLAPIVAFAIAVNTNSGPFAVFSLILAPICAMACAYLVVRSAQPPGSRTGLAVLTGFAAMALYGAAGFAGCVYALRGL